MKGKRQSHGELPNGTGQDGVIRRMVYGAGDAKRARKQEHPRRKERPHAAAPSPMPAPKNTPCAQPSGNKAMACNRADMILNTLTAAPSLIKLASSHFGIEGGRTRVANM